MALVLGCCLLLSCFALILHSCGPILHIQSVSLYPSYNPSNLSTTPITWASFISSDKSLHVFFFTPSTHQVHNFHMDSFSLLAYCFPLRSFICPKNFKNFRSSLSLVFTLVPTMFVTSSFHTLSDPVLYEHSRYQSKDE